MPGLDTTLVFSIFSNSSVSFLGRKWTKCVISFQYDTYTAYEKSCKYMLALILFTLQQIFIKLVL